MKNKRNYVKPIIELINILEEDVICTSTLFGDTEPSEFDIEIDEHDFWGDDNMKTKTILLIGALALCLCPLHNITKEIVATKAAGESSLPTTINLNSVSESDVRSYYSSLNSLNDGERQGNNLLKNLKTILRNNFKYYSYDNIWKAYEITDRDWNLSPASSTTYGTYNAGTNTITSYQYGSSKDSKNNPYVRAYYRDHQSKDSSIIEDSKITAWGDHNASGINREHLWPQSHGFKASSDATGPAGTDLHHLVAADGYVNQTIHNNYPYGYVKEVSKVGNRVSTTNNKIGTPKTTSASDLGNTVCEPQDQDKGDIARACFYMVAMYNNIAGKSGVISEFDPNLQLAAYVTEGEGSEESSDNKVVCLGNLKDLLEWNRLDPVDEYEIYRNDLIYRNYQMNRNPFVDFPEWADYIWGDYKTTKSANPTSDSVYTYNVSDSTEFITTSKTKAQLAYSYNVESDLATKSISLSNSKIELVERSNNNTALGLDSSFTVDYTKGSYNAYVDSTNFRMYAKDIVKFTNTSVIQSFTITNMNESDYPLSNCSYSIDGTNYTSISVADAPIMVKSNTLYLKGTGTKQIRIKTLSFEVGSATTEIENVSLRFGAILPYSDLSNLMKNADVTGYGVFVAKSSDITSSIVSMVNNYKDKYTNEASLFSALEALGVDTSANVRGNENEITYYRTNDNGETTSNNGTSIIFNAFLRVPNEELTTSINAVAYMVIDNEYLFLEERVESVSTLASEYIATGDYSGDLAISLDYLASL